MEELMTLGIYALFGLVCGALAKSRGRNPVGWFFIGLLIPCLGLILVMVLPDEKVREERRRGMMKENRRLRETLKKDRMTADRRNTEVHRRLEVHDVALGVDTREVDGAEALGPVGQPPALPPQDLREEPAAFAGTRWCYADGNERSEPLPFRSLRKLWSRGLIDEGTLVWTEGMQDWAEVGDLEDLRGALDA